MKNKVQIQQVKKALPFTVTPITDINKWRLEQRQSDSEFQAKRQAKFDAIKKRITYVPLNELQDAFEKQIVSMYGHEEPKPKSLIQKIKDWFARVWKDAKF